MTDSPLAAFLLGRGADSRGRRHADILAWPDDRLEAVHDFIQWLFPLPEPSGAKPSAPLLTAADVARLKGDPAARDAMTAAAERMRRFYEAGRQWRVPLDHNHLRITRIIRSLGLLLGPEEARAFHAAIVAIAGDAPINARTRDFWRRAEAGR